MMDETDIKRERDEEYNREYEGAQFDRDFEDFIDCMSDEELVKTIGREEILEEFEDLLKDEFMRGR